MPVQGNILNPIIPMSAKPVDVVGSLDRAYEMRQNAVKTEAEEDAYTRDKTDRAAMDNYLKQGGDITTPTGMQSALDALRGRVSSDFYTKLADHGEKIKKADLQFKTDMVKLNETQLGVRAEQMDQTMSFMAGPIEAYKKALPIKGKIDATADFEAARNEMLAKAAGIKGPDGKPLYSPDVIQQVQNASPEMLQGMLASTKYYQGLMKQRLEESQIARNTGLAHFDDARAKILDSGGSLSKGSEAPLAKWKGLLDKGLITQEEYEQVRQGLIAGAAKPGQVSEMTPEAIHDQGMQYYLTGQMQGRFTPRERGQILNEAARIAHEQGDTAEEATIRRGANKANQLALNTVTRQRSMTSVFERDAEKRLTFVLGLARKADVNGVPAVNRWENAGRQAIAGDEDVNNLNSAMIALQAELAKVLSGSLTNAGSSNQARDEAAMIINKSMGTDMLESLVPNIRKELKFKMSSFDEEIDRLKGDMRTPRGDKGVKGASGSAQDQAEILQKEYNDLSARLAGATGDDKARINSDLDALRKEAKKNGVTLKEPAAKQLPKTNAKGWVLHQDAKGNKAYVGPKGEIEEAR